MRMPLTLHNIVFLKPFENEMPPRLGLSWGSSLLLLLGIILLVWYLIIRQRGKGEETILHAAEAPAEETPEEPEEMVGKAVDIVQAEETAEAAGSLEVAVEAVESPVIETAQVESETPAVESAAEVVAPAIEEALPVENRAMDIPVQVDDLKIIEGIGPKIASLLNEAGISTFQQLAGTEVNRLNDLLVAAGLRRIADPGTWPEQARLAAEGKWDELRAFTEKLKGGRRVES